MSQKIALVAASAAATLTLVVALAFAGFAPGASRPVSGTAFAAAAAAPDATPRIQVDTVYVAAPVTPATVTVHKIVGSTGGDESEQETGNRD